MLSSMRKLTKSKVGPIFAVTFLLLILASFALADLSNFQQGSGDTGGWAHPWRAAASRRARICWPCSRDTPRS